MGAQCMDKEGTCRWNVEKCFFAANVVKTSVDEVFMHHFEKMSSASEGLAPRSLPGSCPWTLLGLPSFRSPHCPPLEKKSCGRPCLGETAGEK